MGSVNFDLAGRLSDAGGCIPTSFRPTEILPSTRRVLDETPKFLRERLAKAEDAAAGSMSGIGSSDATLFG